jgi:hypothetical protein
LEGSGFTHGPFYNNGSSTNYPLPGWVPETDGAFDHPLTPAANPLGANPPEYHPVTSTRPAGGASVLEISAPAVPAPELPVPRKPSVLLPFLLAALAHPGETPRGEPTDGRFGRDNDGDGYTDNFFLRQLQKLLWGPYQKFTTNSPGLDVGDGIGRNGRSQHDNLGDAARQSVDLMEDVAQEAVIEASTAGLGWLAKVDDVNDLRKAAKTRTVKGGAPRIIQVFDKFRDFTYGNLRHNLKVLTGKTDEAIEGLHAHHVFPDALEGFFSKAGIKNIHNPAFGAWWDKTKHLQNSSAYQKAWEAFFKKYEKLKKTPTVDQIFAEGRRLGKEFGFDVNF